MIDFLRLPIIFEFDHIFLSIGLFNLPWNYMN